MLRQYLYISTAPDLPEDTVAALVATCKRYNSISGLTGFLLYNGRNFLQMLEGEDAVLQRVLARIGSDPRHSGMSYLDSREISARTSPDWEMRHIRIVDDVADRQASLEAQLPGTLDPEVKRLVNGFAGLN